MPYYVYILECKNKALYTGITTNLERRFARHRAGEGGHYTRSNRPTKIRYHEVYSNRSEATKREIQIKRWSRTKKLALIKGDSEKAPRLKLGAGEKMFTPSLSRGYHGKAGSRYNLSNFITAI